MISIHVTLKQDDVKGMVEKFLEYVMNNHHVNRERATILQAFQISLVRIFPHYLFTGKEIFFLVFTAFYRLFVCEESVICNW
jgi:hypothetical protein